MRGVQRPSPLASITPADTAGSPSPEWNQIHQLRYHILRSINPSHHHPNFLLKQLPYMLHVRQYLCINNSALDISYQGAPLPSFQHHSRIKCPRNANATHWVAPLGP
eukprot:1156083-Pelagomonas_calceolata.AAC.1